MSKCYCYPSGPKFLVTLELKKRKRCFPEVGLLHLFIMSIAPIKDKKLIVYLTSGNKLITIEHWKFLENLTIDLWI